MKLNKKSKVLAIVILAIVAVSCLFLSACDQSPATGTQIKIAATQDNLSVGETFRFIVLASDGGSYTLSVSEDDAPYLQIDGDSMTVLKADNVNRQVVVTATLNSDKTVQATTTITIVPVKKDVNVQIIAESYTLDVGFPQTLTITPAALYTLTFSEEGILSYNVVTRVLSVVEAPLTDTNVVVTATAEDGSKGSATFVVKGLVTITLTSPKTDLYEIDETAKLKAFVSNGGEVTYSVDSNLVEVVTEDGDAFLKLVKKVNFDQTITVTATLKSNENISGSLRFVIHQTRTKGEPLAAANGLTFRNEMVDAISVPQIRVDGVLQDITTVTKSGKKTIHAYDMTTIMETDRWYGVWNVQGSKIKTRTIYVKGGEADRVLIDGEMKDVIQQMYIDKNNKLAYKTQTDYVSIPATWDSQHLWNHISTDVFSVDDFELAENFDPATAGFASRDEADGRIAAFKYKYNAYYSDQVAYILTYLCYSFTPLAGSNDILNDVYFVVDNQGIVGIVAQTVTQEIWTDSEDPVQGEDPDITKYTIMTLTFSEVGTAKVEDLVAYTHDEEDEGIYYNALAKALENMQNATNYTFEATDTTTASPYIDPDDYTPGTSTSASSAASSGISVMAATSAGTASSVKDYRSSEGTVGTVGYVTTDAILFATTGEYSYSMDDELFHTEHTGYKQSDGYYESFKYINPSMAGQRRFVGVLTDILPKFDLSAEIFEFSAPKKIGEDDLGKIYQYSFVLRDNQLARAFANEVSMYQYADDAMADTETEITITVDNRGNLLKTVYPYDLVSGTYTGYVSTVYKNVGTTTIPDGAFNGYVEREIATTWAEIVDDHYYWKHTTACADYGCPSKVTVDGKETTVYNHASHTSTCDVIIKNVFGEEAAATMPQYSVFTGVFGDGIHTAYFFDYTNLSKDGEEAVYRESVGFTVSLENAKDENGQIIQSVYEKYMSDLTAALEALGYTKSIANSTPDKTDITDRSNRYTAYTNGKLIIVVENNHSAYLWVDVYKDGQWTLTK